MIYKLQRNAKKGKRMKKQFYNTIYEEQETQINIDYSNSILDIYTSRKMTYNRLENKLGKPNKIYYIDNKISGGRWNILFSEKKKISSILSRPLLIGNIK